MSDVPAGAKDVVSALTAAIEEGAGQLAEEARATITSLRADLATVRAERDAARAEVIRCTAVRDATLMSIRDNARVAALHQAAAIAKAHNPPALSPKLRRLSYPEAIVTIDDERRGEQIAAEVISAAILALITPPTDGGSDAG